MNFIINYLEKNWTIEEDPQKNVKIFDNINIKSTELLVDKKEFEDANKQISKELLYAINCAIQNVQKFHTAQKEDNITVETMPALYITIAEE